MGIRMAKGIAMVLGIGGGNEEVYLNAHDRSIDSQKSAKISVSWASGNSRIVGNAEFAEVKAMNDL